MPISPLPPATTANGKPTTHIPQLKAAIRVIHQLYGSVPAVDFGPLALRAIQQKMIADGASRRYINQHVGHAKRMYKWAASMEILPAAAYHAIATVPGLKQGRTEARETLPVLPVDDEVVDATLPCVPVVVADMVKFQRLTRGIEKANRERKLQGADMGVELILLPHWHANQLRHSKATETSRATAVTSSGRVAGCGVSLSRSRPGRGLLRLEPTGIWHCGRTLG